MGGGCSVATYEQVDLDKVGACTRGRRRKLGRDSRIRADVTGGVRRNHLSQLGDVEGARRERERRIGRFFNRDLQLPLAGLRTLVCSVPERAPEPPHGLGVSLRPALRQTQSSLAQGLSLCARTASLAPLGPRALSGGGG
jgi:hypothetical protein